MSKEEINIKIAELKNEMAECRGTPCEVGYLRPVQNWNKGKKDEFAMRKTFNVERCSCGE